MGLAMGGRRWRGRALCAIAGVHTLVAGVEFAPVWRELWAAGVVDSVGRDPLRGAVAWFFLFGVLLALLGLAVDELERQTPAWHSPTLAVGLLVLVLIGVTLMPASGFWLALPVAWRHILMVLAARHGANILLTKQLLGREQPYTLTSGRSNLHAVALRQPSCAAIECCDAIICQQAV